VIQGVYKSQTDWRTARTIEQEKRAWAAKQRVSDARFLYDALMDRYLDEIQHEKRHDRAFWASVRLTDYFTGVSIPDIDGRKLSGYSTVADILRHKCIQTTMRYAHLAPDNARRAVADAFECSDEPRE